MSSQHEHTEAPDPLFDELYEAYHRSTTRLFDAVAADLRSPYIRFLRGLDASFTRLSNVPAKESENSEFYGTYAAVLTEIERAIVGLDSQVVKPHEDVEVDFDQRLTMAMRKQPTDIELPRSSSQYQARVKGVVPAVTRLLGAIGFAIRSVFDRSENESSSLYSRRFTPQLPFDIALRDVVLRALAVYLSDISRQYAARMVNIAAGVSHLAKPEEVREVREQIQQTITWLMKSPNKGHQLFDALFEAHRDQTYQLWKGAGTIAIGPSAYVKTVAYFKRSTTIRTYKQALKQVGRMTSTTAGSWRHSIGMSIVHVHALVGYDRTRSWLDSAFEKHVASTLRQFRTFLSELKESTVHSGTKVQSHVLESRASEHVAKLVAAINTLTPDKHIDEFIADTRKNIDQLPEKVHVFKHVSNDDVKQPTDYPLRSLLALESSSALEPLTRLSDLWSAERGVSITEVNDIPGVLEFLMDMRGAADAATSEDEGSDQAVLDGLARVDSLLDRIEQRLAFGTFLDSLKSSKNKILELSKRYSKVETLQQAYIRKLMLDARGVFKILMRWGYKGLKVALEYTVDLFRKLPSLFSSRYSQVKKLAGLQEQSSQVTPAIVKFRASVAQHIAALPNMYVRLFSEANEDDSRFYVTDEAMFAALHEALTIHNQGFLSNCAVVGSPGSGRSSLVWAFLEQHATEHMFNVELQPGDDETAMCEKLSEAMGVGSCSTWQQLEDMLMGLEESPVCFIENIHVLYSRVATKRSAMHGLIHLFSATTNNVTWIVTVNVEMWQYLDRTMNFGALFFKEMYLDYRSAAFVRKTVERRHRVSGFKLDFVDKNTSAAWWSLSKSLTPQQRADLFFDELTSLSNGNVGIAHQLWLRSVKPTSADEFKVEIASLPKGTLISQLTLQEKFVLHTTMIHEYVRPELIAEVLRISSTKAEDVLSRLFASGLLVHRVTENGKWYTISRQFYGVVRNVLKAANMVH